MKNASLVVFFIMAFIFVWLFAASGSAEAQCAMCRATVENNVSNGDIGIAAKLNTGILYLFAMPYLAILVIAIMWYKSSNENLRKIQMAELRRKRIQQI
jgi:hypothetical protein